MKARTELPIRLLLLGLTAIEMMLPPGASAHDFAPPPWERRTMFTTLQAWEFISAVPATGALAPDDGAIPTFTAPPRPGLGTPGADPTNQAPNQMEKVGLGHTMGDEDSNGWRGSGEGSGILFGIPNWKDNRRFKYVRVQVTIDAGGRAPSVSNLAAAPAAAASRPVVTMMDNQLNRNRFNVQFRDYYLFTWRFEPNPERESFFLSLPTGTVVDQVIIDTISTNATQVPEPASLTALGMGLLSIAGLYRRRKR